MNLTLEQRLRKASIAIMAHPEYVAMNGVFMIGEKRVEPDPAKCPTAYTNGKDEVYGADFVAKCSDANLRFLMIHECKHKLRRDLHVHRFLHDIDPRLANMAMDFVINGEIVNAHKVDGFAKMDGPLAIGCYDPKYDGWSTVQVFNDLKKQKEEQGGGSRPGLPGPGQPGSGQGEPLDDHGWGDAQEMTEEEQEELQREIDTALRQGAIAAGKLGHDVPRDIADLLKPKIDWREALREFITTTCAGNDYSTWRRPNRRYMSAGLYMPSGVSERVGRILTGADMSGSIGDREQAVILGAIADMSETVKPEGLDMIYWDTAVRRHEAYDAHQVADFIKSTKPRGGGGTDVTCVPEFMREHRLEPQCAIILTDGHLYRGWSEWSCPVLWVIFDNPGAVPTCGSAIHISSADL